MNIDWPQTWTLFAAWPDLPLALIGLLIILLATIWWRQQTERWFRIVLLTLLVALILNLVSLEFFLVPPYTAGCPTGCTGWAGFPRPVARLGLDGGRQMAPLDFALNLLLLWLLLVAASLVWRLLAIAFEWDRRSLLARLLLVLLLGVLPWALLPRVLNPPQPQLDGEVQRLANNARRAAEFTYGITGLWVQRLAFEDLRDLASPEPVDAVSAETLAAHEVCLRGYTYFYLPWSRYRITLDASGTTALSLVEHPLTGDCWENSLTRP